MEDMKKTYIMPEIQFEDTRMDTLMIVSTPKAAIDPDDYVDASEIESRNYNAWDEEEYEE